MKIRNWGHSKLSVPDSGLVLPRIETEAGFYYYRHIYRLAYKSLGNTRNKYEGISKTLKTGQVTVLKIVIIWKK